MVARSPLRRLRGLAGRRPDGTVLLLPHCSDVHTLTMKHPLDVAFLDKKGRVIEVRRLVLPGLRLRNARASAVVERFAAPGPWLMVGDSVVGEKQAKGPRAPRASGRQKGAPSRRRGRHSRTGGR